LFDFYSKLIHRWIEYAASQQSINRNERQELNKCLAEIQNHISTLILSALVASDSAAPSVVTYLDRISIATTTALKRNPSSTVLPIIVPEIPAFYLLLLSSSLSTVSRLCAILKRYYTSISESQRSYSTAVTSTINTYLMDTCNLLYRARAFVTTDKNSAGCLCPPTTLDALQLYLPTLDREYSLASMFCCSWHALVSSAAHDAFREMEREAAGEDLDVWHSGPVGQRSLVILANEGGVNVSWKEYRIKVLQWLSERGLGGLEEFLFATIKDLSK
jgi:centromere protein I